MLSPLFNLVFPNICYACQRTINTSVHNICIRCRGDLAKSDIKDFQSNEIQRIFSGRLNLEKAVSYLKFEKQAKIQHLLHHLKYKGIKEIGTTLGELASLELSSSHFFDDIDLLLPIPIHKVKKFKRGYNQSDFIAKGVSNVTNIQIDTSSIVKEVNTKSQTRKSRFERYQNVDQTFKIENDKNLIGKHILLVDDVITTGATIESCGNLLRNIKGIRLSLLTIAFTN